MTISLSDYYDKLFKADWAYPQYDSRKAFQEGQAKMDALRAYSKESKEHYELYRAFEQHAYASAPLPKRPEEKVFRTGEQSNG